MQKIEKTNKAGTHVERFLYILIIKESFSAKKIWLTNSKDVSLFCFLSFYPIHLKDQVSILSSSSWYPDFHGSNIVVSSSAPGITEQTERHWLWCRHWPIHRKYSHRAVLLAEVAVVVAAVVVIVPIFSVSHLFSPFIFIYLIIYFQYFFIFFFAFSIIFFFYFPQSLTSFSFASPFFLNLLFSSFSSCLFFSFTLPSLLFSSFISLSL